MENFHNLNRFIAQFQSTEVVEEEDEFVYVSDEDVEAGKEGVVRVVLVSFIIPEKHGWSSKLLTTCLEKHRF